MNSQLTVQQILEVIASDDFDVSTLPDRAIFYSGVDRAVTRMMPEHDGKNWKLAEFVSGHIGFCNLEGTLGGSWLFKQNLSHLTENERNEIWASASIKFAQAARGNVTAYVEGAREDKIFRTHELPALLANLKVSSINQRDCEVLRFAASLDSSPGRDKVVLDLLIDESKYNRMREELRHRMECPHSINDADFDVPLRVNGAPLRPNRVRGIAA
jgi:hypothetical protein